MGMYDEFLFQEEDAPRCPEGHPITYLQTKDFDSSMTPYYVFRGLLYKNNRERADEIDEIWSEADSKTMVITSRKILERVSLTQIVRAYERCSNCKPVLHIRDNVGAHWDKVEESYPWCEFDFYFKEGFLEKISEESEDGRESRRDKIRERLLKNGAIVLDDNDKLAIRHFKRMELEDEKRKW